MFKSKIALLLIGFLSILAISGIIVLADGESDGGRDTALLFAESDTDSQMVASLGMVEISRGLLNRALKLSNRDAASSLSEDQVVGEVVRYTFARFLAVENAARNDRDLSVEDVQWKVDAQKELCESSEENSECASYLAGLIEIGLAEDNEDIWGRVAEAYAESGTMESEFVLYLEEQGLNSSDSSVKFELRTEWEKSLVAPVFARIDWRDQGVKAIVASQLGIEAE